VARVRDGGHQAEFVADHVRRLLQRGYKPTEIAVLYRAHYHAMDLQLYLTRASVPYIITSGVRFFEQAHVKDVCALLRILYNPGDELAFLRLMELFPKVGEKTARKIWDKLGGRFDANDPARRKLLHDCLPPLAQAIWKDIEPICIAYYADNLAEDPGEVIHQFLKAYYQRHAMNTFDNYERRVEDLEELILFTTKFESVEQMLSEIALLTNLDAEAAQDATLQDRSVRLSTVHQAKGLEWRAVILIWVAEGMFPSPRAIAESPDNEAEERRLFYVAITRAKDDLVVCIPTWRKMGDGGVMPVTPSRFIREIPTTLYDERHIR
jgi:DNA helicase-2/ATP-dependent DNA helicase PcrA